MGYLAKVAVDEQMQVQLAALPATNSSKLLEIFGVKSPREDRINIVDRVAAVDSRVYKARPLQVCEVMVSSAFGC